MQLFVLAAVLAVAAAAPQFGAFPAAGSGATFKKVTTVETSHSALPSALPLEPRFAAVEQKTVQLEPSLVLKKSSELHHAALTKEATAAILEQDYQMSEPGAYVYRYKTDNGIEMAAQAAFKSAGPEPAEAVQGSYSWVAPTGEKYTVEYVADETGYHARGAHIPEIPEAIARSLEWIAAHPDPEARKYDQEN